MFNKFSGGCKLWILSVVRPLNKICKFIVVTCISHMYETQSNHLKCQNCCPIKNSKMLKVINLKLGITSNNEINSIIN